MELEKKLIGGIVKELPKNHSILDLCRNSNDSLELISVNDLEELELDFLAQNGMAGPGKKNLPIYQTAESFSKKNSIPLLIRELPVFRVKTEGWWRFSWHHFFCDEGLYPYDDTYNRWDEFSKLFNISVKDWNRPGDSVLICLQKSRDSALNKLHSKNYTYQEYCINLINEIKSKTDRNIIIRAHPRDILLARTLEEIFKGLEFSFNNHIDYDFSRAWCCITYNSNSAVEAVLNGISSIVLDSSSPAYDVSHHSIEHIETNSEFDIENWLRKIAFMQWSPEEIISGKAWYYIKKINWS